MEHKIFKRQLNKRALASAVSDDDHHARQFTAKDTDDLLDTSELAVLDEAVFEETVLEADRESTHEEEPLRAQGGGGAGVVAPEADSAPPPDPSTATAATAGAPTLPPSAPKSPLLVTAAVEVGVAAGEDAGQESATCCLARAGSLSVALGVGSLSSDAVLRKLLEAKGRNLSNGGGGGASRWVEQWLAFDSLVEEDPVELSEEELAEAEKELRADEPGADEPALKPPLPPPAALSLPPLPPPPLGPSPP